MSQRLEWVNVRSIIELFMYIWPISTCGAATFTVSNEWLCINLSIKASGAWLVAGFVFEITWSLCVHWTNLQHWCCIFNKTNSQSDNLFWVQAYLCEQMCTIMCLITLGRLCLKSQLISFNVMCYVYKMWHDNTEIKYTLVHYVLCAKFDNKNNCQEYKIDIFNWDTKS